ncbi:MAG: TIR domain-containing protein [Dehalococcoidia bacterium]
MATRISRHVFTSFQYEDLKYANLIHAWAANENNDFTMYNERLEVAVDSDNAEYIKRQIRPKIRRASVLICIIGPGTYASEWVNWEISFAKGERKGLVGVRLGEDNRRPREIIDAGAIFVPYKRDDIEDAIEEAATSQNITGDWVLRSG